MKRLALIVSAIAMTATAYGQDATEMKSGGEFRVRYENFFNKSGNEASNQEAHTDARLKYNMNIRKGEKLQAQLGLLHSTRLGNATGTAQQPVSNSSAEQAGYSAPATNALIVNRAWGWWRATDAVSFKVGRFGIDFADGAVFSENDWESVPYAHEGLNVAFDTGFAMFNLYGVKQSETGAVGANSDSERNLYMVTADLKNMPEAIKMANVHLIQVNRDAVVAAGANPNGAMSMQHVGFTLGGDVAGFMYKGTAAFQFGTANKPDAGAELKQSSNMFDVMVGYALPETMGLKLSAGYHMDSGESSTTDDKNETYQALYYDRHNYGGLMDAFNWGNLSYWNLNAAIMPMEDLEVGAGFYMFSRTQDTATVTAGDGFTTTPNTAITLASLKSGEKALGSELDLFANKAYGPDMKVGARYSMLMPGSALKDGTGKIDKTAHMAYLQASIGF